MWDHSLSLRQSKREITKPEKGRKKKNNLLVELQAHLSLHKPYVHVASFDFHYKTFFEHCVMLRILCVHSCSHT